MNYQSVEQRFVLALDFFQAGHSNQKKFNPSEETCNALDHLLCPTAVLWLLA